MAEADRVRILQPQESSAKDSLLGPLVESHGARIGTAEGDIAALKASVRALAFEVDAGLDATKSRLGQVRNVESRAKKLVEEMRAIRDQVRVWLQTRG